MFRLTRKQIAEIDHAVAVANSQARRDGVTPEGAQIVRFSCLCNCFHIEVRPNQEPPRVLLTGWEFLEQKRRQDRRAQDLYRKSKRRKKSA